MLCVLGLLRSGEIIRDSRVVYVQPRDDLKIAIKPDKEVHLPGESGRIHFQVTDAETAAADLAITNSSSNPGLIPVSNIVLDGSGSNRTVVVTPAPNQFGSALVTLMRRPASSTAT